MKTSLDNPKPFKKYYNDIHSSATGSITNLLNITPDYTPKKASIHASMYDNVALIYEMKPLALKKQKITPDLQKIRTSSDYAGKKSAHTSFTENVQ